MYKEFGKAKDWKRVIFPAILDFGCFSAPISVFVMHIAIERMQFDHLAISVLISFFVFLFSAIHIRNLYNFPPIEIDENFLVVNQPLQNRKVYTLKNITWMRKFLRAIIIIHNGYPALVNVGSRNKQDALKIIELIKAANKQRNSDSSAVAPPPVC